MSRQDDSLIYHKIKNRLFFVGFFLDIVILLFFFFSGLTFFVRDVAFRFSSIPFVANGIYIFVFSSGIYLLHFPLTFFTGFIWEHKFKLSRQKFSEWFADSLKKAAIGFVIIFFLVEVVYVLLARYPEYWWLGAGVFWLFLTVVMARLMPNVIIPLFYKYSSVTDSILRKRIFRLFDSCNIGLKEIYSIDLSRKTGKANAFLCGMGSNRRVVLSDTLINDFSADEIEAVVAHELGHYKHRDIVKLISLNSIVTFTGFFLAKEFLQYALGLGRFSISRIDDIAFFPMIVLTFVFFGFFTAPLLNAYSRKLERAADSFSIKITGNQGGFISMMKKLAKMNLAEQHPGWLIELFLYDHPPVHKRIKFAEEFFFK